jgi:hypothetical protein
MEPLVSKITDKQLAALALFESLPDTAAVGLKCAALISGVSERTWRRAPPIRTFQLTPKKRGANVGQLRRLVRGELTAPAA